MKKPLCALLILFSCLNGLAQPDLDSLTKIWHSSGSPDSVRFKALYQIAEALLLKKPDSTIQLCEQGLNAIAKQSGNNTQQWKLRDLIARAYLNGKKNTDKALEFYLSNSDLALQSGLDNEYIRTCRYLGQIYGNRNQYYSSEIYYGKAIQKAREKNLFRQEAEAICEEVNVLQIVYGNVNSLKKLNDVLDMARKKSDRYAEFKVHRTFVQVYNAGGLDRKVLASHARAELDLAKELNNQEYLCSAYFDMGMALIDSEDGINYFKKSLASPSNRRAGTYNNIAYGYLLIGKPDPAKPYIDTALTLGIQDHALIPLGASNYYLADIAYEKGNYGEAIRAAQKALSYWKEGNHLLRQNQCTDLLSRAYRKQGDLKKAIEYLELTQKLKDSSARTSNEKEVALTQSKIDFQNIKLRDSLESAGQVRLQEEKLARQEAINKQQRQQTYFLYAGLGLTLLFGGFIYSRFKVTARQKNIIARQKLVVEEKNREITDSINYARRIQTAILPPKKMLPEHFRDSFILYKPKDIVAGDFYWVEEVGNRIFFAVADCTGHGVPGALVSVICHNGLNRSIREYDLKDPGLILDKTREIVINSFEKSEDEVKDGMDISLCVLEGHSLSWAGANNPLWVIRDGKLLTFDPDKQPIGKYAEIKPFTSHQIEIHPGDQVYLFSDGYADQFGGPGGKKFKSSALKSLLLNNYDKSMNEQQHVLEEEFMRWKAGLDQVDDVCIMGIRLG